MAKTIFIGDSRGKEWPHITSYPQLLAKRPLGPEVLANYHQGGSLSGSEKGYKIRPYRIENGRKVYLSDWVELSSPLGAIDQLTKAIANVAAGVHEKPDTVVINTTNNDQIIMSEVWPFDSTAESAEITANDWVVDYLASLREANPLISSFDIAENGWDTYSWHKLKNLVDMCDENFNYPHVVIVGPLHFSDSPVAIAGGNAAMLRAAQVVEVFDSKIQQFCQEESCSFLKVSDLTGDYMDDIHKGQDTHKIIANRLAALRL